MLPVLGALEERHRGDPLAVIGVHSPKFDHEKDPAAVQAAILRLGVRHPVVLDRDMMVWRQWGVRAWPTLALVWPSGRVAGVSPGEPDPRTLGRVLDEMLDESRSARLLAEAPAFARRPAATPDSPFAWPAKVAAATDGRIFVADSGHHRVVVLGPDGTFLDVIGTGHRGLRAGAFTRAHLDDPRGLAEDRGTLYIADAGAHSLLAADLADRKLIKLAGTGGLGAQSLGVESRALATALRSPVDVVVRGRDLLFASAGSHQVGVYNLDRRSVARLAGSGSEGLVDGARVAAAFAQPNGIALDGDTLYVADSGTSAVRAIDLVSFATRTLTGTGLFAWSDGAGPAGGRPLLQHPSAVAVAPLGLVVADTFNNQLKRFSADHARLERLPSACGSLGLDEPGGLAVERDGSILVADTNRSRLVRLDPKGETLTALEPKGVPPPAAC